ncbi:YHYH domain-containing protein [Prosthecobacter sp.]|uniref:YHYH domain-containing protein n=1 Tax=Prosthecobacter sp. TaxID=1965333 RepID=UPI00378404E7
MKSHTLLILVLTFSTITLQAHPGGLDKNGGHKDKDGNYHYHKPQSKEPPKAPAKTPTKKSSAKK